MNPILLQATYSPSSSQIAMPVAWMSVLLVPVIMLFLGTVLGSLALRDIRRAHGRLGGAMLATLAAGLLPALIIIFACGAVLTLFMESLSPAARARSEVFLILGAGIGVWLSFLMLRAMHRQATGWVKPVASAPSRSALATAAIIFTINGGVLMLLMISANAGLRSPRQLVWLPRDTFIGMQVLPLAAIVLTLTGLICGLLSRHEPAGKTCAWISGALLLAEVLLLT